MYAAGGRLYRPELDAVRFIAFLCVFFHHCVPSNILGPHFVRVLVAVNFTGGFGLCLFFILSAFLIADLLMRERQKTSTVDVVAFFKRRILRIWPLYILGLLIGTAAAFWLHEPVGLRFLAYFFLLGNWYCFLYGWIANPMTHLDRGTVLFVLAMDRAFLFATNDVRGLCRTHRRSQWLSLLRWQNPRHARLHPLVQQFCSV